ncbi:MAG: hypothetical protein WBQ89_06470, partial [Candidatus Acidiferrum sp.]
CEQCDGTIETLAAFQVGNLLLTGVPGVLIFDSALRALFRHLPVQGTQPLTARAWILFDMGHIQVFTSVQIANASGSKMKEEPKDGKCYAKRIAPKGC